MLRQAVYLSGFKLSELLAAVAPAKGVPKPGEILLLTSYTPNIADYGRLSAENKRAYAQRHGYGFRAVTDGFDPARPPAWSKIRFIADALKEYRHVFWTDADALIMNPEIRLETFISPGYDIHITRALAPFPHIQTGNFLVTRSAYSRFFLWATWHSTAFIHHSTWEQAAINFLIERYPSPRIQVSTNRLFNSYGKVPNDPDPYQEGDFMVHFPGLPDKEELIRCYSTVANNLPKMQKANEGSLADD